MSGRNPIRAYAQIIVDVLSKQVDRPFDYAVPLEMQPWIEVGSRVAVTFANRTLQGFVVGFASEAEVSKEKVKPIEQLLDAVPPLTPHLIELGKFISDKYACTRAAAMQLMIPAALKGKAHTFVRATQPTKWLRASEQWTLLERLIAKFPEEVAALKAAIMDGTLETQVSVKDQLNIKKRLMVVPYVNRTLEIKLSTKQVHVCNVVESLREPCSIADVAGLAEVGEAVVKTLASKGVLTIQALEVSRDPYAGRTFAKSVNLQLTEEQEHAYRYIQQSLDNRASYVYLLHGITGSGKTEIYLQAIAHCLRQERQAIVLVPEISLTPQMVERFKSRFGDQVAVLHSRLSPGERYDEWRKIRQGHASVAIGARSAVFAPFAQLGLVIIDEEHESSYKQEDSPKYHAREVAIQRARSIGATVVLGSATPSLESYAATSHGGDPARGATLLSLPSRALGQSLPPVQLIDMREQIKQGHRSMFSEPLLRALAMRMERQEQSVLLLNRRGYASFVLCRSCGYTPHCPNCDITLTYHSAGQQLRCHYCDYREAASKACSQCESDQIRTFGMGTQKVEEELARQLPGIRVIRMDVDTTSFKGAHEQLLAQFASKQADVLLGTQMVAKGLDFPDVTLVGVIDADTSLFLPDFRAGERTFQLLTQVAGRAGRHTKPGEVFIQTFNPEHYALVAAQTHNYEAFRQVELQARRAMGYPPFCRLIGVTMAHVNKVKLIESAMAIAQKIEQLASAQDVRGTYRMDEASATFLDVLGPVDAPLARINNKYRMQCMIKYRGNVDATSLVKQAIASVVKATDRDAVSCVIDVDPMMVM